MIASQLKPAHGPQGMFKGDWKRHTVTNGCYPPRNAAQLLKLSPKTVRSKGEQFEDAGFVFTRAGTRKRGEVAWEIMIDELQRLWLASECKYS